MEAVVSVVVSWFSFFSFAQSCRVFNDPALFILFHAALKAEVSNHLLFADAHSHAGTLGIAAKALIALVSHLMSLIYGRRHF